MHFVNIFIDKWKISPKTTLFDCFYKELFIYLFILVITTKNNQVFILKKSTSSYL